MSDESDVAAVVLVGETRLVRRFLHKLDPVKARGVESNAPICATVLGAWPSYDIAKSVALDIHRPDSTAEQWASIVRSKYLNDPQRATAAVTDEWMRDLISMFERERERASQDG